MDRHTAEPEVRNVPGERAREWVEYHHEVAAPSTYVYDFVWDFLADAEGPFVTDVDGNVLLDFTSHVAAAPLGYNNPKIADKLAAFDLPDPGKIAGQDFYVSGGWPPDDADFPGPAELMHRLRDAASHYGAERVFLSNSGAEAVENAVKVCYDHVEGDYGVCFQGAFHGRTLGTLSLNRSKAKYRDRFPQIDGVHDVPFCRDRGCTPETCSCGFFHEDRSGDPTSQLRKALGETGYVNPDRTAYVVLEPVQGEGGYYVPSDSFMEEIADLCDTHDVPLIVDEIQSGMGRTGEMWGSDHFAVEPDVLTVAKGARVGATISTSDIFPEEKGRISSTWGAGDVVASLQGALTLEAIEEHDLLDNAARMGRHLDELVADADLPAVVDRRGLGLMFAVEFATAETRDAVVERAFRNGLLTLGCGTKSLRMLPPLDVTEREIETAVELFEETVREATAAEAAD
ncbi:aspartate aminotransferase family protein [Halobacteriales archaeon SW_5_70_135]|nr:MAG: aspartate aminotransferase family protein [Halobacteriales archaeon SW_5_70_135]